MKKFVTSAVGGGESGRETKLVIFGGERGRSADNAEVKVTCKRRYYWLPKRVVH